MKGWKNRGLSPQTLAWIELADASGLLPVVWYGCLPGDPARLMAGLRGGAMTAATEASLRRFVLYQMPARSKTVAGGEGRARREGLLCLKCSDGRIDEQEFGLPILCGCLERVAIGRRCFEASRFDLGCLLQNRRRADS
jgi:hypothetical protein